MSTQWNLLKNGIPVEVLVVLILIVILPVIAIVVSGRREAGGESTLRATGTALAVFGLVVAGYVFSKSGLHPGQVVQCIGGGGGCAVVEHSEYSNLLKGSLGAHTWNHMSTFGLVGYLLILGSFVWQGDRARIAGFALSLFGFGFSLYLTWLELWKILAICQWCVTSAAIMTMLFVVSAVRMFRHYGLDEADDESVRSPV